MKEFIDKSSVNAGTPLNRTTMMALQGFVGNTTSFSDDGKVITETNEFGEITTTELVSDNQIIVTIQGEKRLQKRITFNADGTITEELV